MMRSEVIVSGNNSQLVENLLHEFLQNFSFLHAATRPCDDPNCCASVLMYIEKETSDIFDSKSNFHKGTTRSKFDPTGVRTHELWIMTGHFMTLRYSL